MDPNFVPFGEHRLKVILEGVLSEGDKAESAALEAKSGIDVSQKDLGITKVTKFILGGRLPADDDREVLFIVVDPPEPGEPPYPCHKDFQPQDKEDAEHALRDGALYVRDKTNTRTAKAVEVLALFERGKAASTPDVAVSLTCDGSAVSLGRCQRDAGRRGEQADEAIPQGASGASCRT